MKAKSMLSKIFTAVAVVALAASVVFGVTGAIDAKADGEVKKLSLKASASGVTAVQANTALALGERQYADMIIDFEKMPATAIIDLAYASARMRVEGEVEDGFKEGVTLYADPGWLRGTLNSSTAKYLTSGWANTKSNAGDVAGWMWINGNAALGASNVSSGAYRLRYRVYGDGTMVCYVANAGAENYYMSAVAGYIHNGTEWVADEGIAVADKIFPTIRLRNCGEAIITHYETAVYDCENVCDGANFLDGTIAEGSGYVETFEENTSELRIIAGTAKTLTVTSDKTTVEYPVVGGIMDGSVDGAAYLTPVGGMIASVYGEKLTLASGQYAEATFDVSGVGNGAWMETKFMAEKPVDGNSFGYETGDGMLLINDGRARLYSPKATSWYDGWGNLRDNNYAWVNYVNGNGLLGVAPGSDSLRFRVRIYDDGTAIYYLAAQGQENWFGFAYIGWKHNGTAWVKEGNGLTVVNEGYFALGFRNTSAPKLTAFTAGVYNYNVSEGEAAGTLVGELYTEKFGKDSKFETVAGEAKLYDASNALSANADADKVTYVQEEQKILIDNATDAGYVYSRFVVPATDKTLSGAFTLQIPELTGSAKAVLYLAADGKDVTNAAKLIFALNADGKIVISDGTAAAVTDLNIGEKFTLTVTDNAENKILINDAKVEGLGVGAISGKAFAFGLSGVTESDKAKIAYYGLVCEYGTEVVSESNFAPAIKPYPVKLATPVVTIDENGVAKWNAVENASGYKYVIDNAEAVATTETSVTLGKNQTIKVMAAGDGENYLDSDYSEAKTYEVVPQKLATPVVTIDENGVAKWNAVENASGYKYVIDNAEAVATTETSVTLTGGQTIKVMATGDGENFADGDYSEAKKYVKSTGDDDSSGSGNSGESSGGNSNAGSQGCFGSIGNTFGLTLMMLAVGLSVIALKKKRG